MVTIPYKIIIIICLLFPLALNGQICERNYLTADSILCANYEKDYLAIYEKMKNNPELRDSLELVSHKLLQDTRKENSRLALKYAATPSGIKRVYMVRGDISKEKLDSVLLTLPDSIKGNPYSEYIRNYISERQIAVGDSLIKFSCQLPDGRPFEWSIPAGRRLLLVYDGLSCMGKSGRERLGKIVENSDSLNVVVIIYTHAKNKEELSSLHKKYELPMVSDFQIEGSVMNNVYGAQAQPTCYFFDEKGYLRNTFQRVEDESWDIIK